MLWKSAYNTLVLEDVLIERSVLNFLDGHSRPFPTSGVLIGGFGLKSLREIGIWKRLCDSDLEISPPVLLVLASEREKWMLASAIPGSQRSNTFVEIDSTDLGFLPNQDSESIRDRSFAALLKGPRARLLMVGLPTEEAWDQFKAAFQELGEPILQPFNELRG